jgi:Fic family protein
MPKITGKDLKEKIKENWHMSTYYVDPDATYVYFSLPSNLSYKDIINRIAQEKISNPRTVTIGNTIHFWKPVGEENRQHYTQVTVAEEQQKVKKKKVQEKSTQHPGKRQRKNVYTLDISWCTPGKQYTLDQIMKKLSNPASKATVLKSLKELVDSGKLKLIKRKPFTVSVFK